MSLHVDHVYPVLSFDITSYHYISFCLNEKFNYIHRYPFVSTPDKPPSFQTETLHLGSRMLVYRTTKFWVHQSIPAAVAGEHNAVTWRQHGFCWFYERCSAAKNSPLSLDSALWQQGPGCQEGRPEVCQVADPSEHHGDCCHSGIPEAADNFEELARTGRSRCCCI